MNMTPASWLVATGIVAAVVVSAWIFVAVVAFLLFAMWNEA